MSNSLAKVHPELVSEWAERNFPLTPDDITYGSNKRVWWKGSCGHEWQASVKARSKGEGCPICSGARAKSLRRKQSENLFRKKWAATKTPQSPRQTKTLCQGKTQNRQICKLIRVSQSPPRRSLRSKKNLTDMLHRRNREKKQSEPCRRPRNLNLKRKRLKPFISNPNPNRRNRKRGNHNDKQFYAEKGFR